MNVLDTIDAVFQMAAASTITHHPARNPKFEGFWHKVGDLQRLIGDQELDSEWLRVIRDFRRYRYDASRIPLPFNHPYLTSRISLATLEEVVGLGEFTRPDLVTTAMHCLELLKELIQSASNPLLDVATVLANSGTANDSSALVLAHSRYISPVLDYRIEAGLNQLEVLEQNALRRAAFWNSLIVIGDVGQLDDFVFSSPRAREIQVISYPWHHAKWVPTKAFQGGLVGEANRRQRLIPSSLSQSDMLDSVNLDEVQERLLENHDGALETDAQSSDRVAARLHELFGGKGVLLEASDRKTTMILDLEAHRDDRVSQVPDNAIEEGMYVVLRTDSEGGYIVPIADQMLGAQAKSFRLLQVEWKSRLRKELENRGTDGLAESLAAHGSRRANYQNIQNWISSQSIAPELSEDFRAIARVCGIESRFQEMKSVVKKLRTAHTIAGQRVRRQLRELVREVDATNIDRQGYETFELPELPGAQLTAFRVERRSAQVTLVPASAIERVFDLDVF